MAEDDFEKFRKNLRMARYIKEMTSKELSVAAGLKQQKRVSDIEDGRGKPTLEEVIALCNILSQPIDFMLNNTAKMKLDWQFTLATWQDVSR